MHKVQIFWPSCSARYRASDSDSTRNRGSASDTARDNWKVFTSPSSLSAHSSNLFLQSCSARDRASTSTREPEIIEKYLHTHHLSVYKVQFLCHLIVVWVSPHLTHHHHPWAPTIPPPMDSNQPTTTWPQSLHHTHALTNPPTLTTITLPPYSPTNAPLLCPTHPTTPFPNHHTTYHTWPQPPTTSWSQSPHHLYAPTHPSPTMPGPNQPMTSDPNHPTTPGPQSP